MSDNEEVIDLTRPLSTARPCDACGGPHTAGLWHEIETRLAVVNGFEANRNLALFGVRGLAVAEAMSPHEPIKVSKPIDQLRVCVECVVSKPLSQLIEQANARAESERGSNPERPSAPAQEDRT